MKVKTSYFKPHFKVEKYFSWVNFSFSRNSPKTICQAQGHQIRSGQLKSILSNFKYVVFAGIKEDDVEIYAGIDVSLMIYLFHGKFKVTIFAFQVILAETHFLITKKNSLCMLFRATNLQKVTNQSLSSSVIETSVIEFSVSMTDVSLYTSIHNSLLHQTIGLVFVSL